MTRRAKSNGSVKRSPTSRIVALFETKLVETALPLPRSVPVALPESASVPSAVAR